MSDINQVREAWNKCTLEHASFEQWNEEIALALGAKRVETYMGAKWIFPKSQ